MYSIRQVVTIGSYMLCQRCIYSPACAALTPPVQVKALNKPLPCNKHEMTPGAHANSIWPCFKFGRLHLSSLYLNLWASCGKLYYQILIIRFKSNVSPTHRILEVSLRNVLYCGPARCGLRKQSGTNQCRIRFQLLGFRRIDSPQTIGFKPDHGGKTTNSLVTVSCFWLILFFSVYTVLCLKHMTKRPHSILIITN